MRANALHRVRFCCGRAPRRAAEIRMASAFLHVCEIFADGRGDQEFFRAIFRRRSECARGDGAESGGYTEN
jgi:hypothetical protein